MQHKTPYFSSRLQTWDNLNKAEKKTLDTKQAKNLKKQAQKHTCKKRVIPVIYHRKFFWIFRKILSREREINTAPKPSPEVSPSKMEVAPY